MKCDRKTIFHDKERPDVEGVRHAGERARALQEDLLLAPVDVDEDVGSALGVGALDLLRK